MAVPAFIGRALQFFGQAAGVKSLFGGKKDDGLGDQENRKKLAARAFLEGYEPDSRLFAKGPVDDAPDVVIPEPLTQPVTNILPPQPPVVPQLVPAGAPLVAGEEDKYILQELNRIDSNIIAIAAAMQENMKSDAEYRAGVIEAQKEELARRGKLRSQKRKEEAKSFRQKLFDQVSTRTAGIRGRLKGFAGEVNRGILGYGALLGAGEIYKQRQAIQEFMDSLPEKGKELLKSLFGGNIADQSSGLGEVDPSAGNLQSSTSEESVYGIDPNILRKAVNFAEARQGGYSAIGPYLPPRFPGDTEVGRPLGAYQFMTYRGDLRDQVMTRGMKQGMSKEEIEELFAQSESRFGNKAAAEKMLKILGQAGQEELMRDQIINGLTQIKRKYPNASPEFMVRRFAAFHLSGNIDDLTSKDPLGTSGAAHGDKIYGEYLRLIKKMSTEGKLQSSNMNLEGLFSPSMETASISRGVYGGNTQMLEPLIIDQSGYKVKEPPVTSTMGGSETVPFRDPSSGASPYSELLFGAVT